MISWRPKKPQEVKPQIAIKITVLIIGLAITYQVFNSQYERPQDEFGIYEALYSVSFILAAIAAFHVARKYWWSDVFGKTYLALALGYVFFSLGNITWYYQTSILKVYLYPSISDFFFFMFYPFACYHLLKNSIYFKRKLDIKTKIRVSLVPIAIVIIYSVLSLNTNQVNTDFYIGLIFVSASSITLSFAILGATVFRKSLLGPVWGLLVLGIGLSTIADVWYYHLQILGEYEESNILNMIWILSSMFVTYALYKHEKAL